MKEINLTEQQLYNFWAKVNKDGPIHPYKPELGQCWIWTASTNGRGYSRFRLGTKKMGGHNISVWISGRDIPEDMQVNHTCCVRSCVNPEHLEVVTRQEDSDYKCGLGRQRSGDTRGEINGNSKLKENDVLEIRELYATGEYFQRELAVKFGVSSALIVLIVNNKIWKHV